jgi:hypothetical protein
LIAEVSGHIVVVVAANSAAANSAVAANYVANSAVAANSVDVVDETGGPGACM